MQSTLFDGWVIYLCSCIPGITDRRDTECEGTPDADERVIGAGIVEVYEYNQRSATGTGWILTFSHCPGEK